MGWGGRGTQAATPCRCWPGPQGLDAPQCTKGASRFPVNAVGGQVPGPSAALKIKEKKKKASLEGVVICGREMKFEASAERGAGGRERREGHCLPARRGVCVLLEGAGLTIIAFLRAFLSRFPDLPSK